MRTSKDDWEAVKAFYFEAALKCYAGEGEEVEPSIGCLPGSFQYRYWERGGFVQRGKEKEGDLSYFDVYQENGNRSCGNTSIYRKASFGKLLIFRISYLGWSNNLPRVDAFHKMALREAYQNELFLGGRGPERFTAPEMFITDFEGLVYTNQLLRLPEVVTESSYCFSGLERITGPFGNLLWHKYEGFALFPKA